jgi:hypothetical protein
MDINSPIFATTPFSAISQLETAAFEGFEAFPSKRRFLDMFVVVDYLPVALTYGVVIDFALGALDYLRLNWDFDNEKNKGVDSGFAVGDLPIVW